VDCVFCKIVEKQISSDNIYEDDEILSFKDSNPQAPIHALVIPKKHIVSVDKLRENEEKIIGHMFLKIKDIAKKLNCRNGYRIVSNCGKGAGQAVFHLHFHLLGGRALAWPPGLKNDLF
jgi:histidine triad (HIT) family protein